jgi:hypothetical protein
MLNISLQHIIASRCNVKICRKKWLNNHAMLLCGSEEQNEKTCFWFLPAYCL